MRNKKKLTEYYGVCRHGKNSYQCTLIDKGIKVWIGSNTNPLLLAMIYDGKVKELGLDKRLNFPEYPENLIPNTKQIQLTQGKFAIVDEDVFDYLNQWKWNAIKGKGTWYAETRIIDSNGSRNVKMHRFIINGNLGALDIDHKNGNGLHNYKSNLRECKNVQNCMNRRKRNNCSSIYKGVCYIKRNRNYSSVIKVEGNPVWIGAFAEESDAALAYNDAAIKYFGSFARLNEVTKLETNPSLADKAIKYIPIVLAM